MVDSLGCRRALYARETQPAGALLRYRCLSTLLLFSFPLLDSSFFSFLPLFLFFAVSAKLGEPHIKA